MAQETQVQFRRRMQAAERAGRKDYAAGVRRPAIGARSLPERVAEYRGWMLAAAEHMPGQWADQIPALPADPDQRGPG